MLAKLVVEDKEFDIEILDPKLQELIAPKKNTGYERVEAGDKFWCVDLANEVHDATDNKMIVENKAYKSANYYSSCKVAEANARADKLMRQLRRFCCRTQSK